MLYVVEKGRPSPPVWSRVSNIFDLCHRTVSLRFLMHIIIIWIEGEGEERSGGCSRGQVSNGSKVPIRTVCCFSDGGEGGWVTL